MTEDATAAETGFSRAARLRRQLDALATEGFGGTEAAALKTDAAAVSLFASAKSIHSHARGFLDSQRKTVERVEASLGELRRDHRSEKVQAQAYILGLRLIRAALWGRLMWHRYWKLLAAIMAVAGVIWLAARYGPPAYSYITGLFAEIGTFSPGIPQETAPATGSGPSSGPQLLPPGSATQEAGQ